MRSSDVIRSESFSQLDLRDPWTSCSSAIPPGFNRCRRSNRWVAAAARAGRGSGGFARSMAQLVLRAVAASRSGTRPIEQVHRWLFATAELGFVPVPIRDRAGQSLQEWHGTLWEITPWLAGVADPSRPPVSSIYGSPSRDWRRSTSDCPRAESRPFHRACERHDEVDAPGPGRV